MNNIEENAKKVEKLAIAKLAHLLGKSYRLTEDKYDPVDGYIGDEPVEAKDRNTEFTSLIRKEGFLIDRSKLLALEKECKKTYYIINCLDGICYAFKKKKNWKKFKTKGVERSASRYHSGTKDTECVFLPIEECDKVFYIRRELDELQN